jgi:hypothetical protein
LASGLQAFATSVPKMLAAAGGLLATVTALIAALNSASWLQRSTPTPLPEPTATVTLAPTASPTTTATATLEPSPTASPTVAPQPPTTAPVAAMLVANFESATGWDTGKDDDYFMGVRDGEYAIEIRVPEMVVWGEPQPRLELSDLRAEVDVRQIAGDTDAYYGIVVRCDATPRFYLFGIASDGMAIIQRNQDEEWTDLTPWVTTDAIHQGVATNRLRVECMGDQLRLYVNDQLVVEAQDDAWASGDVGLVAATLDQDALEVRFDNLIIQPIVQLG